MDVFITRAAGFMPNEPVGNDDMEQYLGMIDGKPSRAKNIILRRNGIYQRYYALDKDGNVTHTNHQMAANAIRKLFDNNITADDINLFACGTASPEQLVPSHGVMVHGELEGQNNAEVVSFAGSCCTGVDALKYAYLTVALNPKVNAVASASERLSAWMRASYFQKEAEMLSQLDKKPMLAFEKEFLRWMLSDGAYALLLQGKPNPDGISLRIDWIEITSFANTRETCMYAGADKDQDGNVKGWSMYDEQEWLTKSIFAVKQDTRMLSELIVKLGVDYFEQLQKKLSFTSDDIDWFLPHLSSMLFKNMIMEELANRNMSIDESKWFVNLPYIGNIASASAFAMTEELMHSGKLKKGQKILVMVPESARFSYCYFMMTVC